MTSKKSSRQAERKNGSAEWAFQLLLNGHPVPMWVCDLERLTFLAVNDAAVDHYGYRRDEFLAMTIGDICPPEVEARLSSSATAGGCSYQRSGEWQHRLKDGRVINVESSSHTLEFDGRKAALVMARDITKCKQAEERIHKLNRSYAMLSEANQAIVRLRDPQALFEKACHIAIDQGGFRMAWIGLRDPQTGEVRPVACAGATDGYLEKLRIVLDDSPRGQGPTASALRAGEHVVVNDIENDPRMAPWRDDALQLGFRASAAFPLIKAGQVCGTLNLYAAEPDFFDEAEVKILDQMAADFSFALEFAEHEEKRRLAEEERERMLALAVTAGKQAATARNLLASIIERISDSFVALDKDWRYTYVSNRAACMLQREKPEDLLGKHIWTEYPEGMGQPFCKAYYQAVETQMPVYIEEYYEPWSRWFENRIYPSKDGLTIYFTDITERRQAEAATRRERDFSSTVLDSLPGVFYCFDEQRRFLLWNRNFENVTGYKGAEISRMNPLDFFAGPEKVLLDARIREVFAKGASEVEADFVSKDGSRTPYYFTGRTANFEGRRCVVGVGIDISDRRRAEEQLRVSREQLRALAGHLESARESERQGIARDIHDDLGQSLTGLKIDLVQLAKKLPAGQPELHRHVEAMVALTDETINSVRRIMTQLRPAVLDDLGLAAAVEWQGREFEERTGIQCRLALPEHDISLDPGHATAVFRIYQESLTNVARHAFATAVDVRLDEKEGKLVLEVRDNGRGFATGAMPGPQSFGLIGMRERALLLGGSLEINSAPGAGTAVRLEIPLAR